MSIITTKRKRSFVIVKKRQYLSLQINENALSINIANNTHARRFLIPRTNSDVTSVQRWHFTQKSCKAGFIVGFHYFCYYIIVYWFHINDFILWKIFGYMLHRQTIIRLLILFLQQLEFQGKVDHVAANLHNPYQPLHMYYNSSQIFNTLVTWWYFTGDWVTASLIDYLGLF